MASQTSIDTLSQYSHTLTNQSFSNPIRMPKPTSKFKPHRSLTTSKNTGPRDDGASQSTDNLTQLPSKRKTFHDENEEDIGTPPPVTRKKTSSQKQQFQSQQFQSQASQSKSSLKTAPIGFSTSAETAAITKTRPAALSSNVVNLRKGKAGSEALSSGTKSRSKLPASASESTSTSMPVPPPPAPGLALTSPSSAVIQYTRLEDEANEELEILNRQLFAVTLSRVDVESPTRKIFPGMAKSDPIFRRAEKKTNTDMKNWKARCIKNIKRHNNDWIADHENPAVRTTLDFKRLREFVNDDFEYHWFQDFFHFLTPAIDLEAISENAKIWLRYASVQLATKIRLNQLLESGNFPPNKFPSLQIYTSDHINCCFDGLHLYKDLPKLTLRDFPLVNNPMKAKRAAQPYHGIDPNQDPDGHFDISLFKAADTRISAVATATMTTTTINIPSGDDDSDEDEDEDEDVDSFDHDNDAQN